MDPFELAAARIPELSIVLADRGDSYSDVFLHDLDHSVVESTARLKGSRFGPPRTARRRSITRGIAYRILDQSGIGRFNATADLTPDGLADGLRSPRLDPAGEAVSPRPVTQASAPDDGLPLGVWASELLDRCMSAHDSISHITVHLGRIRTRRVLAVGRDAPMADQSVRIEARVVIDIGDLEVSAVRSLNEEEVEADDAWLDELSARLVARARRRTARRGQISGRHAVVLGPGWGGVWMHEAIGHQLEADSILRGASSLFPHMGQVVAPEFVTIVDSGQALGGRVRQTFDDEGVESRETVLVQAGRLVGILTDRATSTRLDLTGTANGRRSHYAQQPVSRMTNLLLRPGRSSPEELVGGVYRGIYVSDIGSARYDPASGLIHLFVIEAQLIENGRVTHELAPMRLSSDPESVLRGIVGVADDFEIDRDRGYCEKDGVVIPVGIGQPSILIRSMDVGPGS